MLVALDSNPGVVLAVGTVNLGCSVFGSDDPSETQEPEDTPIPEPTPTREDSPDRSKCEELAQKIIELSREEDPLNDTILEISDVETVSDNLLGVECKGLSYTAGGEATWIKFHQKRIGGRGYETLMPGDYLCEYLVPQIVQLSQDGSQGILLISEIQQLRQNEEEIACTGTATLEQRESLIEFWLNTTEDDGKPRLTYGYELADAQ